jgi:preprotein translocase subunit SecG
MASAFGGGSSQTAFGARAGATLLTKMTTVCAVLFMVGALVLAILAQRGPASLVSGTAAPPAAQKPATPVPAGTTPAPASTPTPATPAAPAQAPASNPPAPQPPK